MSECEIVGIPRTRQFLSVKEAAEILGVGKAFLYSRVARGEGPPVHRIGKRIKFPRKEFQEWASQAVIA